MDVDVPSRATTLHTRLPVAGTAIDIAWEERGAQAVDAVHAFDDVEPAAEEYPEGQRRHEPAYRYWPAGHDVTVTMHAEDSVEPGGDVVPLAHELQAPAKRYEFAAHEQLESEVEPAGEVAPVGHATHAAPLKYLFAGHDVAAAAHVPETTTPFSQLPSTTHDVP